MTVSAKSAASDQATHAKETQPFIFYSNPVDTHETEESETWLLSYADMVTLLMCFFILFFTLDKSKGGISDPERIKSRLEQLIGLDSSVMTPPSQATPSKSSSSTSQNGSNKAKLEEDLAKLAKNLKIVYSLATPNPNLVEITFLNANFFESGQTELTESGRDMILKMAPRLAALGKGTRIEVEGHTDTDKPKGGRYASNWELSALRAAMVVRLLESQGIAPDRLKIAGFGEYRPVVRSEDSAGIVDATAKKMNRRVVIRVTHEEGAGGDGEKNDSKHPSENRLKQ